MQLWLMHVRFYDYIYVFNFGLNIFIHGVGRAKKAMFSPLILKVHEDEDCTEAARAGAYDACRQS